MSEIPLSLPPVQASRAGRPARSPRTTKLPADIQPPAQPPIQAARKPLQDAIDYLRDFTERGVLFWDTLRQRANNMIEHERAGKPPLLDFDYEMLLDARRFERPANYALLRITRAGDVCFDACVDESKPPVIVVDPRAGHGPGIGGFKRDSEVGMAMHEGHTVYFVIFFVEPCPGQTLADVLHALRRFVDEVARYHPGKPPILYGNCQAGWAVTLLSADCEGVVGPVVLNGSPLSYWAGEAGVNPMRLAAGFVGGTWLTHFLADLGGGRFDGAWLAANFENLKPEAVWEKYANLFTQIDTERERFLAFERWWNGFYFLGQEEIVAIVENLFVGNRLEEGTIRICDCCLVDLRRIRNPIVIFASWGDNITPPHQALGWIPAVYRDTNDLKAAKQRIVYLTDPHAGHLGLFVSASVARLEHRAILESLDRIEALEPGLYELKIDNPTGDPDCHQPHYCVHFEERHVENLVFDTPRDAFEQVRRMSELNEAAYRTFVSPFVRTLANPWSATTLEWAHPMRTSRYLFSEMFAPWMGAVAQYARILEQHRTALPTENPYLMQERAAIQQVSSAVAVARTLRDSVAEQLFTRMFG
ncbi:DUF3141 domain-containing protein [Burkholderia pseudomallei]|uniref:DUF3141 domain-containing protein n=1 Tax=Burkholderia pseudomallei TaxID=28450 RepID=UPI000F082209|nr:DUF3141 domain-containing protein [Burkholderia pseudomallei]VCJ27885.1 putative poly(3-hydroxyalkanoate) synthetase [Burkholderia pseudomallei]VCJ29035.1 putative poly(3-hydroxyalkanoate) synthetase [Burkholderia pseudomallei]